MEKVLPTAASTGRQGLWQMLDSLHYYQDHEWCVIIHVLNLLLEKPENPVPILQPRDEFRPPTRSTWMRPRLHRDFSSKNGMWGCLCGWFNLSPRVSLPSPLILWACPLPTLTNIIGVFKCVCVLLKQAFKIECAILPRPNTEDTSSEVYMDREMRNGKYWYCRPILIFLGRLSILPSDWSLNE